MSGRSLRLLWLLAVLMFLASSSVLAGQAAYNRWKANNFSGLVQLPLVYKSLAAPPDLGSVVLISAGMFQMGCTPPNDGYSCESNEIPLHEVFLSSYYINRTEVTNAQYVRCVAAGACTPPASNASWTRQEYYNNPEFADYPVTHVSWEQANAYCVWGGGRLPSEAEWEKAARGSLDTRTFPWGENSADCSLANYYDLLGSGEACLGDTSAVGSYPAGASPYSLLDMAGNILEWVNDWYSSSYYEESPTYDPSGPSTGTEKVLRGGSWSHTSYYLRLTNRMYLDPYLQDPIFGFRCAADIVR